MTGTTCKGCGGRRGSDPIGCDVCWDVAWDVAMKGAEKQAARERAEKREALGVLRRAAREFDAAERGRGCRYVTGALARAWNAAIAAGASDEELGRATGEG